MAAGLDLDGEAGAIARAVLSRRGERTRRFGHELAQEPVWNMLLALLVAYGEERLLSVQHVCRASNVPQTTALRYLHLLERAGHVSRTVDPTDRRRQLLQVNRSTAARLARYLVETETGG